MLVNARAWKGYATALAAGGVGALAFYLLHMPLPFMLGSLCGALIAANLPGLYMLRPTALANPVRAILGVAIGAAFTPALLQQLPLYLVSLLLLLPFLVVVVWAGLLYFQRIVGFERRTAFFCSLPGGLLEMTLICESYGADMRRVALIHTTRVLLIIYSIPFAIHLWTDVDLSGRTRMAAPVTQLALDQAAILAAAAVLGWWAMRRLRLPGAAIVGPMICSALVYTSGWVSMRVPDELINVAQLILGAGIGTAFVGVSLREGVHAVAVTLGYFVILMAAALSVALAAHLLVDIPLVATVLAFIPGGQAEMNVIALMVGVAVPYIALHHVLRMFLVMTVAPPLSAWLLGGNDLPSRKRA